MDAKQNRRGFLADVGSGMLVASVGYGLALDMGLTSASAAEDVDRLTFGALEPLVGLMQETSVDQLLPVVVERLRSGTPLRQLVAAAALANARTFGGEDYVGFHTMMALAPAYHMAAELPEDRQALPVLKVLYRNTSRIQESGGRKAEVLRPVEPAPLAEGQAGGDVLRQAVRNKDVDGADRTFAAIAQRSADDAFNSLLFAVQDNTEVHRVVLPYRAWDLLAVIGKEQALTLLRQSVHYCVVSERDWTHTEKTDRPRTLLPQLLDQYHLLGKTPGTVAADDAWIDRLSKTFFESTPDQAADAAAAALAEGFTQDAIGEAISLAANQLVLRDQGRTAGEVRPGKPLGSVHGDSIGVHASDSANAWRNMARVSNPRNTYASLILGAYQVAFDRTNRGGDFLHWAPHPLTAELEPIRAQEPEALLREASEAIREGNQFRACAAVHRYGELGYPERPVFNLLLGFAVSEDGALHAEKYYRTVSEEFATTRPAFRWRQLVSLARVTASEAGSPAAGYAEACQLLKV
jgi:hypothetical protein